MDTLSPIRAPWPTYEKCQTLTFFPSTASSAMKFVGLRRAIGSPWIGTADKLIDAAWKGRGIPRRLDTCESESFALYSGRIPNHWKMQEPAKLGTGAVDIDLLRAFEKEILGKVPHVEGGTVLNATPLVDLTQAMKDCAREEYGLDFSSRDFRVFGKLEAPLLGGSVKSRAAAQIV